MVAIDSDVGEIKPKREGLPFYMTFLYSLGSAAGLFLYNTFNSFVQFFYVSAVGLPAPWVGRGLFAFGFWNALNDPIVGWIADSKKSAIGRRSWFIRTIAIPVAIGFMAIWLPPFNIAEHGARVVMIYFLIIISVYDVLQSLITLSVDALLPEMFQEETARLNGAVTVTFVGSVLGGVAVALAPLVYSSSLGWGGLAVIWGIVAASLYLISLFGIRENPKYAEAEDAPFMERLREVMQNKIFLIVIALNLCFRMILATLVIALPFYTEYVLQIEAGKTSQLIMVFVISYTIAMLMWQPAYKRFGTRNTLLISMSIFAASSLPVLIATDFVSAMGVVGLIGFGLGGPMLVGAQLLFADTVDEDYARTGIRREGLYRGMLGFVYRWPPAFAGLLLGELLGWSGFDATLLPTEQPMAVADNIRYFIAFTPLISALLGAVLAYIYPLYGERLRRVQIAVQERNREMNASDLEE